PRSRRRPEQRGGGASGHGGHGPGDLRPNDPDAASRATALSPESHRRRIGGKDGGEIAAPTDDGRKHAPRSLDRAHSSANGSVAKRVGSQGTKVPLDYKTFSWQGDRG